MIGQTEHARRVAHLRRELSRSGLDAFLVTSEVNVSYLSGFTGHDSMLFITGAKKFVVTDSRYSEEATASLTNYDVRCTRVSTYSTIKELIESNNIRKIGFESMNLPYEVATRLRKIADRITFRPIPSMVETIRAIKSKAEIDLIKRSIGLARSTFSRIVSSIRPGKTESEIASLIEVEFARNGAQPSFDPIVAAGHNTSKPHAEPSGIRIANNDLVMVDLGCRLGMYCSDMTRMVAVGKVPTILKKIYLIVKAAQEKAIAKIMHGASASMVDEAARSYIEKRGYGKYFSHATGHGLGMEVHEQPSISGSSERKLSAGMVFTVEPAIYIPKIGGVRIEDVCVVTKSGCELLTR